MIAADDETLNIAFYFVCEVKASKSPACSLYIILSIYSTKENFFDIMRTVERQEIGILIIKLLFGYIQWRN